MCGRYAQSKETDELIQDYVAEGGDFRNWRASYNLAPTGGVPILIESAKGGTDTTRRLRGPLTPQHAGLPAVLRRQRASQERSSSPICSLLALSARVAASRCWGDESTKQYGWALEAENIGVDLARATAEVHRISQSDDTP